MMNLRLTQNSNLTRHTENQYRGLPILTKYKPFITEYLAGIYETCRRAFTEHPRTFAVRVELRFPKGVETAKDSAVISRFFESLKAQIKADLQARYRNGRRVRPCTLRYVWVKECSRELKDHYHVLILLNNDTYHCLGSFGASEGNMAARVKRAWASALRCTFEEVGGAVYFPKNACYHINANDDVRFFSQYRSLFKRVSYFAKERTKQYGDYRNSFGCSRS